MYNSYSTLTNLYLTASITLITMDGSRSINVILLPYWFPANSIKPGGVSADSRRAVIGWSITMRTFESSSWNLSTPTYTTTCIEQQMYNNSKNSVSKEVLLKLFVKVLKLYVIANRKLIFSKIVHKQAFVTTYWPETMDIWFGKYYKV